MFHDNVSDCRVVGTDHTSIIDSRHAHTGAAGLASTARALATQSWVNASASLTFAPYLTHATIRPVSSRPLLRSGDSAELISPRLSALGLDFMARGEIGAREDSKVGCRHGS